MSGSLKRLRCDRTLRVAMLAGLSAVFLSSAAPIAFAQTAFPTGIVVTNGTVTDKLISNDGVGGNTSITGGYVTVYGGTNTNAGSTVTNLTYTNAALGVSGGAFVLNGLGASGGLGVTGGTTTDTLTVTNGATFQSSSGQTTTIDGTTGALTSTDSFGGNTNVTGGYVTVTGGTNTNAGGDVGTLTSNNAAFAVSGGAYVDSGLVVTGGANITGDSSVTGNLGVTGDITATGTVSGNTLSAGTGGINSAGLITGNNGLLITSGGANITGGTTTDTLTVSGVSNLNGGANVQNGLGVTGGTTTDTLKVTGTSTFGSSGQTTIDSSGNVGVGGNLSVNGNTTVNNFAVNPGSNVSMGGNVVHDVGTPIFGTDAANKAYVDAGVKKAEEGVAIAMSIQNPILTGNDRFGVSLNWGDYAGNNAFGLAAAGIVGRNLLGAGEKTAITAGFGFSSNGEAAGRAGVQFTW